MPGERCLRFPCISVQLDLIARLVSRENQVSTHRSRNSFGPVAVELRGPVGSRLCVRAAIHGQTRTGDVGRLWSSHERYQRGDIAHGSITV